jgi:hypothetical protein
MLDFLGECAIPGRPDVWIRDNVDDDGTEPSSGKIWSSPDIKACGGLTECAADEQIVRGPGLINSIYVTLRNNGPNTIEGPRPAEGNLVLCYSRLGGRSEWDPTSDENCSGDWSEVGVVENVFLGPNTNEKTIRFEWTGDAVPDIGHYCFLARWVSDSDPMTFPERKQTVRNTQNNNNIAWQNFNIAQAPAGRAVSYRYMVRPAEAGVPTDLVIESEKGFPGMITLDVSSFTTGNAIQGTGIIERTEDTVVFSARGGRLTGLSVPADGAEVEISFQTEDRVTAERYPIDIYQESTLPEDATGLAQTAPQDIGGVRFVIEVLPEGAPPVRPMPVLQVTPAGVRLAWAHHLQNTRYEIWSSAAQEFAPGDAGAVRLNTLTPPESHERSEALTYIDADGATGEDANFYIVRSINDQGETADSLARTVRSLPERNLSQTPRLPSDVWGVIQVHGAPAAAGVQVQALINGTPYVTGTVTQERGIDGRYALSIPADNPATPSQREGGRPGDEVTFVIDDGTTQATAEQTIIWQSGATQYHPLSVAGTPAIPTEPILRINYPNGAPGSAFTLTGSGLTAETTAQVTVNDVLVDTLATNDTGSMTYILQTDVTAQAGLYEVGITDTAGRQVNIVYQLDPNAPLRVAEGNGSIISVPPTISPQAQTGTLYLPLIRR